MGSRQTAKVIAWGDAHCPFQREESVQWLLQVLKENRKGLTHCVCMGDLFEADAASRWENENDHVLVDEYVAGAALLDAVAAHCGDAQLVWLLGNHDDSLQAEKRIDKRLRTAAHWNNSRFAPSFDRWRQLPYGFRRECCLELGQVIWKHGITTREHLEAQQWVNLTGGHAHRLVVGGHTHRPAPPTQDWRSTNIPSQTWYCNAGTIGPLQPIWANRVDTHRWAPAAVLVEAVIGRACQPQVNWEATLLTP